MLDLGALSGLLGYTSIACWLGAQFPQVLENIKRQSCDGLALPFLANWLLGDVSNLIGCLLTGQLLFQTWLAAYFVTVDCMLVAQYIYYETLRPKPPHPKLEHPHERPIPRYRTLSAVAANVAAAAALVAQQEERQHPHRLPHPLPHAHAHFAPTEPSATGHARAEGDDDEPDEDALAALADSFHSEGGRTLGRKRVSWSLERGTGGRRRGTSLIMPRADPLDTPVDLLERGRAAERAGDSPVAPSTMRRSASHRNNIMFLAVFALFSVGALSQRSSIGAGHVLQARGTEPVALNGTIDIASPDMVSISDAAGERILGRIFAWLCTTLYLTSRLPQIWKNFTRKSVEGLSMSLFIFAFLGNVFYVASILTSPNVHQPPPASTAFIRESIPYLLGSAGTLTFDITIVAQSFIYRPRHRRHRSRLEEGSSSRTRMVEEERSSLLSGDVLAYHRGSSEAYHRGASSETYHHHNADTGLLRETHSPTWRRQSPEGTRGRTQSSTRASHES
ncbi:PQ loop repeat-domain-containing protein [Schizophyllum fasciatum]